MTQPISRRTVCTGGLALSGLALAGVTLTPQALAQRGGPSVTVVVPYTAGSAPDLFGRLLTEHLRQLSG
jgi:tripartite-type tricarboxylate transporter receptor subunit TctC